MVRGLQSASKFMGVIHSTKISGDFGPKLNGSAWLVQPEKVSKKSVDRSDQNGLFHLTNPTHSQSQDLAVQYLPCTKWRKIPSVNVLVPWKFTSVLYSIAHRKQISCESVPLCYENAVCRIHGQPLISAFKHRF